MPSYLQTLKKEYQPYVKTFYDDIQSRKDRDFFNPSGTQIYVGSQGSGKTMSAVYHLIRLKKRYPRALVVTNLSLTGMSPLTFTSRDTLNSAVTAIDSEKQYIQFRSMEQLSLALVGVNNGKFGVIYLIDEIHTYFNALDSKNIPMYVFTEISQQRKQRKLIIGTSQLFLRTAKPLREQCDNVIVCKTYFGVLTFQYAYEGETLEQDYSGKLSGTLKKRGWFIQKREYRDFYDTYQKVVSGSEQYDLSKPIEISLKDKKR